MLAGSRFLSSTETRYVPIEGEALAIAWGLDQTKYFTQGYDNLVVVSDHKSLTEIFSDRTLDEISNSRLFRLKQLKLMWRFDIAHLPGKTNCAADAASRLPVLYNLVATISHQEYDSPDVVEQALVAALQLAATDILCLQWHEFALHTKNDLVLNDLLHAVESGFNADCFNANRVGLRQYLSFRDGVILYKDRVVVPVSLRHSVLLALHAAHQEVSAMERPARPTVFWSGMTHDIYNVRYNCAYCNRNAPSQAATPPITLDSPSTPFEHIFADYFDYGGRHFLVIGRWTDVFVTPTGSRIAGAATLIRLFRTYFATFGVLEEISTDGGPEFTAFTTEHFLRKWGVHHRVSSAYLPQPNWRAEVAVKTAKKLLVANVSPNGDLNSGSFLRAILQLRNTPDPDCGMSPAEIVFGRPLRDAFSFIKSTNFPIVIFVELGVKHGEPKKMLFIYAPNAPKRL